MSNHGSNIKASTKPEERRYDEKAQLQERQRTARNTEISQLRDNAIDNAIDKEIGIIIKGKDIEAPGFSDEPPGSLTLYNELEGIVKPTNLSDPNLITILNSLNVAMVNTEGILTEDQRKTLTDNLVKKIRDAITIKQQMDELGKEGMGVEAIKQIFQGLIKYYASLAYYGYQQAPDVLTNIGALLAGSAIIGATMSSSSSSAVSGAISLASQGELLSLLSTYLPSTASYATGIYLLKRGGIPVEKMAQQAVSCVEGNCEKLLNSAYLNSAYDKIKTLLESDDYSVASSSSVSSSSSIDTIRSVNDSIDDMFKDADDPKLRDVLLQNVLSQDVEFPDDVLRSPISDLTNSQETNSPDSFFTAEGSPPIRSSSPEELLSSQGSYQGSNQTIHTGNISMPSDTGTDKSGGKSRRHNRCKKTKKRMKRNRRLTKKGKKHRKTVKHRRRKMRR